MTLGERLRWARGQRGLSLEKLGEAAAVHWVTVQRIETDYRKQPPKEGTLRLLALALGVDPGWLRTGAGEPGGGLILPTKHAPAAE